VKSGAEKHKILRGSNRSKEHLALLHRLARGEGTVPGVKGDALDTGIDVSNRSLKEGLIWFAATSRSSQWWGSQNANQWTVAFCQLSACASVSFENGVSEPEGCRG